LLILQTGGKKMKTKSCSQFLLIGVSLLAMTLLGNAQAIAQKTPSTVAATSSPSQQATYSSYRGVQLGMTDQEVRAKLGQPASTAEEQDYYMISEKEAAQIAYDKGRKVVTISVDYLDAAGAPDEKAVVGGDLEKRPNGSLYKMVWRRDLGFWVSYNRTSGPVVVVTVTIQKIR
jgi:hypothetical protein